MAEKEQAISDIKIKPARVQLDPSLVAEFCKPEQSGEVFNIWYSKWTGGDFNGKQLKKHAKHRCNVKLDSGYTKADFHTPKGEINRSHYFCLYFARGYCCNGKKCEYLHRIPTELDIFPQTVDCFGREKFADYRDDMTGVGSFARVNKTLYIGNLTNVDSSTEHRIKTAFGEFGDITKIRVIPNKNIAFVSYKLESQAQFAKEALFCQALSPTNKSETLNIKWADDDNSWAAKKRENEEDSEMSVEAARKLLNTLRQQNSNKKQKAKVNGVKVNYKSDAMDVSTEKVGLDLDAIAKLGNLRASRVAGTKLLVSGYSSDEED